MPGLLAFATTALGWGAFPGSTPQVSGFRAFRGVALLPWAVQLAQRGAAAPLPSPPCHPLQDIGSGNCVVHNTLLFDHPQKSVLYAPFRFHPQPPFWSPSNRNLEGIGGAALRFSAAPSLATMLPLARQALRG